VLDIDKAWVSFHHRSVFLNTFFFFEKNMIGEAPTMILFFEIIRSQICICEDLNLDG
jgi:hypothetical protein